MKSIKYLDSNVFIRLVIGDVDKHLAKSQEVFHNIEREKTIGKVSILVINEVIWILENYYELNRKVYIPKLLKLLALKELKVIEVKKQFMVDILKEMQDDKIDFTDHYLAKLSTPQTLFSFDQDFEKLFKK